MDNLQKIDSKKAAEIGALGGKAKAGSKHLSTIIREVIADIDWSKTTLKNKEQLKEMYGNNGWKAIVYVAYTKAMAGDPQAMKWLAENGFGKQFDITSDGEKIEGIRVEFVGIDEQQDSQHTDTKAL